MRGRGKDRRSFRHSSAQERAAERPSAKKVELLRGASTICFGQPVHALHSLACQGSAGPRVEVRLAYEFEPVLPRGREEIDKLNGIVVLSQELTEDVGG